jgi:general secretion pathway protein N
MSSRYSLLALGLGVYLAVAISSFPAALAYRWFAPDALKLASLEGTIWRGSADYGAVAGLPIFDLRWQLHPATLLTGRIGLTTVARLPDGLASARLLASSRQLELTEVRANLSLQSMRDVIAQGAVSGRLSLSLNRLDLVDGVPVAAEGSVALADLVAPPLVPMEGVTSIALGNYRAELTSAEQPGILALVNDEGGPLELSGRVQLAPDRSFTLDALIKPRPGAPEVLVQGLELVTGEPNATGHRRFVQQGSL